MANSFLKPTQIAAAALALLQREIVLPRLVTRYGVADFMGAKDDTLTLRVPAIKAARTRALRATSALTADELAETSVDVTLSTHVYSLVGITDAQLTLDIKDFAAQVLAPQVRGIVEEYENQVATALSDARPQQASQQITFNTSTDDAYDLAVEARKVLNDLNVPREGRFFVVGSAVEAAFLKCDKLSKVNESGSSSALRDAVIGNVAGFTVVGSNAIAESAAYAGHRSAVAFANVAPVVPDGATYGKSMTFEGLAMTWLRDYDPTYASDRSLVHGFVGASSVDDGTGDTNKRIVKVNDLTSA